MDTQVQEHGPDPLPPGRHIRLSRHFSGSAVLDIRNSLIIFISYSYSSVQVIQVLIPKKDHFILIYLMTGKVLVEESLFSQNLLGSHTNCFIVIPILSD